MTVHLPIFSFPWALLFWGAYIWAFYISEAGVIRRTKETRGSGPELAQDSLAGLMLLTLVATVSAISCAWFNIAILPRDVVLLAFLVGVGLMLLGSLLRRHCFKMLGESFTVEVRASADQPLVTDGAYRYLRHPGYFAGVIMLLGFGLATGSWLAALMMLASGVLVYVRRINSEEAALLDAMGERYRVYCAPRKKLIPFLY
jgi:protein-S-isoprenylcysteine O-methyltransferase Ste14